MTFLLLLVLLAVGAGVAVYVMRGSTRGNATLISTRLGRYGLAVGATSQDTAAAVGRMSSPVRERSSDSAVSQSIERMVGRGRFGSTIANRLERAHLRVTVGEYISIELAMLLGGMALGLLLKGYLGLIGLGAVAAAAPWFYVGRRTKKRQKRFIEQLADTAQMVANSLRAGFSIVQSFEMVGAEGPVPACEEFERVVTEVKLGLTIESALEHLKERMPSEDIELMVVAISVQRQIGGNLSEILMVISHTIRERVRFERDLKTLTAQARYSSYIITALPIAVGIAINFLDSSYESFLYKTLLGNFMIAIALTMLGMGFFFLRRIANIEV